MKFKGESILAETDLNHNMDMTTSAATAETDDLLWETAEQRQQMWAQASQHQSVTSTDAGVWLIAPLITRLPEQCQLKVLEAASKQLQDVGRAFWAAKTRSEKEALAIKNIIVWNQQPFFALLIACLKDEPRPLLNSLFNGIMEFITVREI